jgi:hypothetical protein
MRFTAQRIVRPFFVALVLMAAGCHSDKQPSAPAADTSNTNIAPEPAIDPIVAKAFSPEAMRGAVVGHPIDPHSLSQTELQFGRAPQRTPDVTYKDDVLIMEHGDTALRSMSRDSLTWHFDANAPGVDQIQVDKIIFATERCVGRVLGVQRNGNDVAVQLGPVQITDVIKKGHFAYNQPVDLDSLIATPAPSMPWIANLDEETPGMDINRDHLMSVTYAVVSSDGTWRPFRDQRVNGKGRLVDTVVHTHNHFGRPMAVPSAGWSYVRTSASQQLPSAGILPPNIPNPAANFPAPPASVGNLPDVDINGMNLSPCIRGCGGIGLKLGYDKNGIKVVAWVVFHLNNPSLRFNLDFSDGVKTAAIELSGAAGFSYHFETASTQQFNGNISQLGTLPIDLNIPIGGFGVPIALHLIQSLTLKTGFSARTSLLSENGDYTAKGSIQIGYIDGSWGGGPPLMSINKNIANGVSGISVGINSLVFGIRQELLVGIGMFGFATGPYAAVSTSFTALKQASQAMVDCRQATFTMDLSAGVGYSLPKPLVSIFNFFLRALKAKEIQSTGSIAEMKPQRFVDMNNQIPSGCATPKDSGD